MRIRLHALIPLLVTATSIVTSPAVMGLLPAKYAAILGALGALAQTVTPALVTDKPKS